MAALTRAAATPKVLVNGSAIGYYGPHGDEELDESSPAGSDYLAQVCVAWESAATAAQGVRVALIRTGVVLDQRGGALKQLWTPFKLGVGGPVGSGKQFMSWIHHADEVGIILLALDHPEAVGPLNATAPQPVTNKAFGKAFGRALGRPAFLPTPGFALKPGARRSRRTGHGRTAGAAAASGGAGLSVPVSRYRLGAKADCRDGAAAWLLAEAVYWKHGAHRTTNS